MLLDTTTGVVTARRPYPPRFPHILRSLTIGIYGKHLERPLAHSELCRLHRFTVKAAAARDPGTPQMTNGIVILSVARSVLAANTDFFIRFDLRRVEMPGGK